MGITCYRWKVDTIKLKGIGVVDDLDKGVGKADDLDEGVGEADNPDERVGEADDLTWPCLVFTFAYI